MFIFRGTHVEQQLLSWRFIHHLPNHTKLSRITSSLPSKHAASITESPSQNVVSNWAISCKACWATPFKMHLTFAHSFAKLSRKYHYLQTPAVSRGRIRGKANTRDLGVWLSQSLTFRQLGCCIWSLFLQTSESNVRQYQDVLQDHGVCLTSCDVYNGNDSNIISNFRETFAICE